MKHRVLALWMACAVPAALTALPAAAQGLRVTPQLGASGRPAAPADTRPRQADYIVAIVNSEPVTNNEVRIRMLRAEQQLSQSGQAMPPRAELMREVLERLIVEKAQIQLARENNMRIEDSMVDRAEQNVAAQYQVDVAEFRRRLATQGLSLEQFREDLRNQLLLSRVRDREVDRVRVSDAEIEQYIRDQQSGADLSSVELNLGHILVAVPESATPEQAAGLAARAQRAQQRASAGEDFTALAREFSQAPGSATLGMRPADRYPALFTEAVQGLAEGAVSAVVRSGAGFHVLKVLEKRSAGLPGMNVIQSRARHILLRPGAQLSERAALAQLAEMRQRVRAGQADFAALAREFSQDASARNGGDLGWVSPGTFVPEFEEAINALAPGEVGEPLVSRFGVHLVQLMERRQTTLSAREQREIVRGLVREKKQEDAFRDWLAEIRGRAYVEYREPPQ